MIHDLIKGTFGALIPLVVYLSQSYSKDLDREIEELKEKEISTTYRKSVVGIVVIITILFIFY